MQFISLKMMHIKKFFFYSMYTPLPSTSPPPAAVLGYPEITNWQYRVLDKDVTIILRTLENEGDVSYYHYKKFDY